MTNTVTALGKVDVLGTAASSAAITSLSPKPLDTASFYLVVDGLIDNLNTYVEDSDSVIAESLNILQFLNNDHFIVWFVIQIIKKYIIVYGIMF